MTVKHNAEKQKRSMLDKVEQMKRFGQFTKENMIAHGFIDRDEPVQQSVVSVEGTLNQLSP